MPPWPDRKAGKAQELRTPGCLLSSEVAKLLQIPVSLSFNASEALTMCGRLRGYSAFFRGYPVVR